MLPFLQEIHRPCSAVLRNVSVKAECDCAEFSGFSPVKHQSRLSVFMRERFTRSDKSETTGELENGVKGQVKEQKHASFP